MRHLRIKRSFPRFPDPPVGGEGVLRITQSVSRFPERSEGVLKIIGLLTFILSGVFVISFSVQAAKADHNVWGWAYSSNIGWISFNSCNCDNGCAPTGEDFKSDGGAGCPSAGTPISNYGVNVDTSTGVFSGYAWSSNIGWISFNSNTNPKYPIDSLFGCPSGDCKAWTDYNAVPKKIMGWARACSVFASGCSGGLKPTTSTGGWDGWIRLNGSNYGVWIDENVNPIQFHQYAWGGNETNGDWTKKAVVGWISFNCKEGGIVGGDICASKSDYKVLTSFNFNRAPSANSLGVSFSDFCCDWGNDPPAILSGTFTDQDVGDYLTGYQIQIDDDTNFDSDPLDTTPPRGCPDPLSGFVPAGPAPNFACSVNGLKYNTSSYYWRAKVWDSKGDSSVWIYPPDSTTPPGISFSTPLHKYPCPSFNHTPLSPSVGEVVNFNDTSDCWDNGNNKVSCTTTAISYLWDFGDGDTIGTIGSTSHTYNSVSSNPLGYTVNLTIRDNVGICTRSGDSPVGVQLPLPEWKEIPPTSMISKFLANVGSVLKNYLKFLM